MRAVRCLQPVTVLGEEEELDVEEVRYYGATDEAAAEKPGAQSAYATTLEPADEDAEAEVGEDADAA